MDYERILQALPWLGDTVRRLIVPGAAPAELERAGLPHVAQAIADLRQNKFKVAQEAFESTLKSATAQPPPIRALLQGYLALASAGLDQLDAAAGRFALAEPDETRRAIWSYNRGALCVHLRRLEDAAAAFLQCLKADPGFGPAWAALTVMHALSREHVETEAAAKRALALKANPPNGVVELSLMQATLLQGRPESVFVFPKREVGREDIGQLLSSLPPVSSSFAHGGAPTSIVFVSCDSVYLVEHGIPLLWSIAERSTRASIHLHVMDPNADVERLLRDVAPKIPNPIQTTFEKVPLEAPRERRAYYSAVRFVRLLQLVAANPGRLVVSLDADVLVRGDLLDLPGMKDPEKMIGLTHFPHEPVWQEIGGGCAWFRAGEEAESFLRTAAAFIVENYRAKRTRWYLDQVALYMAWGGYPRPAHISLCEPEIVCDLSHSDAAIVWAVSVEKRKSDRYNALRGALAQKYGGTL